MDVAASSRATPRVKIADATPATSARQRNQIAGLVVIVALSSMAACRQFTGQYRWHEPYEVGSADWWFNPIDWNIDAGLPDIVGKINAVEIIGARVLVAGSAGLFAHSEDEGRSWILLTYSKQSDEFRSTLSTTPQSTPPQPFVEQEHRRLEPLEFLVPTLFADAGQAPASQQQQASPQKPSPRDISVNAPQFDFKTVQVGSRESIPVQFTNGTSKQLLVDPPLLNDDTKSFSISNQQCYLPLGQFLPGALCGMNVTFAPNRAGDFKAQLIFGNVTVSLTGTGAEKAAPPSAAQKGPTGPQPTPQQSSPQSAVRAEVTRPDLQRFGGCSDSRCEVSTNDAAGGFVSIDQGLTWRREPVAGEITTSRQDVIARLKPAAGAVRDATEDSTRSRTWAVLESGGLFRVENNRWIPVTRTTAAALTGHQPPDVLQPYGRFLPPWYFFVLLVCGLVLFGDRQAVRAPEPGAEGDDAGSREPDRAVEDPASREAPQRPEPAPARSEASAIGDQGTADKPLAPGEPDALGLGIIATGLAFFFRNQKTKPPLVLAINGRWGSGKSSLMNLLRARLVDYGACPVWFNAWHHQREDQLLAALLEAVRKQSIPSLATWAGWNLRLRLASRRLRQSSIQLALVLGAIVLLWQVEHDLREKKLSIGIAANRAILWASGAKAASPTDRDAALLAAAKQMREAAATAPGADAAALRAKADALVSSVTAPPTESGTPLPGPADLFGDTNVLAIIATLFTAFKAASKGLRAFASNPASLLATESGSTNPKALEAQANFRQTFAAEFADVTSVLGPNRRMTILIDDLDRCRPEKVREVLEAVNFLCSSGQCFVVLGMAREIVEHCVGLSFRQVVDTMPWHAFELSPTEIDRYVAKVRDTSPTAISDARANLAAKRLAFARLFLDKLIQIEVSIPQPTPLQRLKLFETDEERKTRHAAELRVTEWRDRMRSLTRWIVPVSQAVVLVGVVSGGGLQLGRVLGPMLQNWLAEPAPQQTTQTTTRTPSAGVPATPGPSTAGMVPQQPAPQVRGGATATPAGWLSAWPFYIVLLSGFGAAAVQLRRLPHQTVRDAKPFSNALGVWHPLVMTEGARNTPRTARRFQNRVRYLAMRQRAFVEGLPVAIIDRWLRKWVNAPPDKPDPLLELPHTTLGAAEFDHDLARITDWLTRGVEGESDLASVTQSPDGPKLTVHASPMNDQELRLLALGQIWIPEPILVALAAIDELAPEWVDDAGAFNAAMESAGSILPSGDVRIEALRDAIARHLKHWDNWHNLTHYRRAYLRLCSELDGVKSALRPNVVST